MTLQPYILENSEGSANLCGVFAMNEVDDPAVKRNLLNLFSLIIVRDPITVDGLLIRVTPLQGPAQALKHKYHGLRIKKHKPEVDSNVSA